MNWAWAMLGVHLECIHICSAAEMIHHRTCSVELISAHAESPMNPEHTELTVYTWYHQGHNKSKMLAMWGHFNICKKSTEKSTSDMFPSRGAFMHK